MCVCEFLLWRPSDPASYHFLYVCKILPKIMHTHMHTHTNLVAFCTFRFSTAFFILSIPASASHPSPLSSFVHALPFDSSLPFHPFFRSERHWELLSCYYLALVMVGFSSGNNKTKNNTHNINCHCRFVRSVALPLHLSIIHHNPHTAHSTITVATVAPGVVSS